jgi:prepilin peptidase CpaA
MPTAVILLSATTAGYFDLRWRRIPNWLVAGTVAVSLSWHAAANGWAGLAMSAVGLFVGIALLFPLFLLRGMGAGDVKFFGAVGAAVTYQHVFTILFISLVVAAGIGFYQVLRKGSLRQTMANMVDLVRRLLRLRLGPHPVVNIDNQRALLVPFTLSVAIATWIFVLFY